MANEVRNLDGLKARIAKLSAASRAQMRIANERNADEFMAKVSAIVPRTHDGKGGDLGSTLTKSDGPTETAVQVSIGGPDAPYPAHLEFGHMGPGGVKVEATPFWYPAKRVLKKKADGRRSRALKVAVDEAKAGQVS